MRRSVSQAISLPFLAALGIASQLLGAQPALAQPIGQFVPINFALQDASPDCPSANLCHFDFSLGLYGEIRQVACQSALLSGTATQIATLTLFPESAISKDTPLIPVKVTGNSFTVSQRVVVTTANSARITIQSFGAGIVAGAACSIAGMTPGESYYSPTTPFSAKDQTAECNDDRTVCTFEFGPVPASHRWVLDQVACRNSLLSGAATEIVTLSTITAGGQTVASFPLIPEKLTGNSFTISQRIAIPAFANHKVRIRIQSFGAGVVALPVCTLSANDVELVPA